MRTNEPNPSETSEQVPRRRLPRDLPATMRIYLLRLPSYLPIRLKSTFICYSTTNNLIIESSAPTRVDLAGGTIDIPPLFLFHEGAATVNFAISMMAHCRIETRDDESIILESIDQNAVVETTVADIATLKRRTAPRTVFQNSSISFARKPDFT